MPTTLRLWHILSLAPVSTEFRKLLRLDVQDKLPREWSVLSKLVLILLAPLMLTFWLPAVINYICLQKGLRISISIANQYQARRHDLLAVTPIGDMGVVLKVAQAYCYSATNSLTGLAKVWLFVTVGAVLLFFISGFDFIRNLQGTLVLSAIAAALFIDYAQCMTWGVVVGIFAGLTGDPFKARLFTFVSYMSLQILFYGAMLASFFVLALNAVNLPDEQVLILFVAGLAFFFMLRESVIAVIWGQIRQRLNDDIPTLNFMFSRQG